MAHAYGTRFAHSLSANSFKEFVIARIARIYPLHLFVLFAFVALEITKLLVNRFVPGAAVFRPFEGNYELEGLVLNVLLLQTSGLQGHPSWNGPAWSIGAEFFAYLLFPAVAALIMGSRLSRLITVISVCVISLLVLVQNNGTLDITSGFALVRCLAGFLLGIAAYRLHETVSLSQRWNAYIAFCLAAIILIAMHFRVADIWFPLLFALLVAAIFRSDAQSFRMLRLKPLIRLGEISYSIYLTHFFVLKLADFLAELTVGHGLGEHLSKAQSILALTLMMAAVILISIATYRGVEAPSRSWLKRKFA